MSVEQDSKVKSKKTLLTKESSEFENNFCNQENVKTNSNSSVYHEAIAAKIESPRPISRSIINKVDTSVTVSKFTNK